MITQKQHSRFLSIHHEQTLLQEKRVGDTVMAESTVAKSMTEVHTGWGWKIRGPFSFPVCAMAVLLLR